MSLSVAELSKLQIANPAMDDTAAMKLSEAALEKAREEHEGYLARMKELGFMDEFGRWTEKGIRECIK